MLGVNPYIAFQGTCRKAIGCYQSALGAEVAGVHTFGESPMASMGPADAIMHAALKIGGSTIMMCDDPRPDGPASGGTVLMPLQKTFWAEASGMAIDRFGVKWMVNCEAAQPAQ